MEKKISYDDTRDVSIRVIKKLIDMGFIEDNDDHYFEIQDTIHDEVNELLGLDIDDNFEIQIKKTITMKSNKLIAEFMELPTELSFDLKISSYNNGNVAYYWREFNSGSWYEESELEYYDNWQWLMPVIEKITELCEEPQELDELKHALLCVDIESVYFIIVEFIKEYNKKQ